jgi:hypothetical protein
MVVGKTTYLQKGETMKTQRLMLFVCILALLCSGAYAGDHQHMKAQAGNGGVTADQALKGVPMWMSPEQLPAQFRTQLRSDVSKSRGVAVLRQVGNDIEYTFAWFDLTSPVISAHFHNAPEGQVGVRAYSICGVAGESPACPKGTTDSISGVWKNALAVTEQGAPAPGDPKGGTITIAFHTQTYPAPIGELAVYIPASQEKMAKSGR